VGPPHPFLCFFLFCWGWWGGWGGVGWGGGGGGFGPLGVWLRPVRLFWVLLAIFLAFWTGFWLFCSLSGFWGDFFGVFAACFHTSFTLWSDTFLGCSLPSLREQSRGHSVQFLTPYGALYGSYLELGGTAGAETSKRVFAKGRGVWGGLTFGLRTWVSGFTVQRAAWRRLELHSGSVSLVLPSRLWEVGRQGAGGWGKRLLASDCLLASSGQRWTTANFFFADFLVFSWKSLTSKKLGNRTPCGREESRVEVKAFWLTFRLLGARWGGLDS